MFLRKNLAAAFLAASIVMTSMMPVHAASYTDIQKHWAKEYIEKISEYKLVSGYEDGKFRPDSNVSRLEAIIMTCNLFPSALIDKTYAENRVKWESRLKQNNIPDWSWRFLVFALENKIIPSSDAMLSSLMSKTNKNEQIPAFKYEAVVFLVNALDWENERSTVVTLKYKDTKDINPQARPYIDVLIKKGIISEKGDTNGYFGAKKGVTRAEMSVMLANSYRYSPRNTVGQDVSQLAYNAGATSNTSAGTVSPNPPVNTADRANLTTAQPSQPETAVRVSKSDDFVVVDGKVALLTGGSDLINLVVTDHQGKTATYNNRESDIQVKVMNAPARWSDIKVGDPVRLLVMEERKLMSVIKLQPDQQAQLPTAMQESLVKGVFFEVGTASNVRLKVGDRIAEYPLSPNVRVTLNGQNVSINDIRPDDIVDLYLDAGRVSEIRATSAAAQTTVSSVSPVSEVRDEHIRLRDALIKEIRLTTSGNKLVVEAADGKSYETMVTDRSIVRYRGSRDDIRSLKVGYLADVYIRGKEAEEILTDGDYKTAKVDGVVSYVDERNRSIEVNVQNRGVVKVYYDVNTTMEDVRGHYVYPGNIYRGDRITVTGYEGLGGIDARTILVELKSY